MERVERLQEKVDQKMSLAKYFFLHTAFTFLLSLSFSVSLL